MALAPETILPEIIVGAAGSVPQNPVRYADVAGEKAGYWRRPFLTLKISTKAGSTPALLLAFGLVVQTTAYR